MQAGSLRKNDMVVDVPPAARLGERDAVRERLDGGDLRVKVQVLRRDDRADRVDDSFAGC